MHAYPAQGRSTCSGHARANGSRISQLCLGGHCRGRAKSDRIALGGHRGVVRQDRAAGWRRLGTPDRGPIHDCRLFIPLISVNTERRDEGYFRREWGVAVHRSRDMAENKTFLLPVVIDDTNQRKASVPEKFRHVQWSHLPDGYSSPRSSLAYPPCWVRSTARLCPPDPIRAARKSLPRSPRRPRALAVARTRRVAGRGGDRRGGVALRRHASCSAASNGRRCKH